MQWCIHARAEGAAASIGMVFWYVRELWWGCGGLQRTSFAPCISCAACRHPRRWGAIVLSLSFAARRQQRWVGGVVAGWVLQYVKVWQVGAVVGRSVVLYFVVYHARQAAVPIV